MTKVKKLQTSIYLPIGKNSEDIIYTTAVRGFEMTTVLELVLEMNGGPLKIKMHRTDLEHMMFNFSAFVGHQRFISKILSNVACADKVAYTAAICELDR